MANAEQMLLYWDIGHAILKKQEVEGWGSKIVELMSADLKAAFPDMKGWSRDVLIIVVHIGEPISAQGGIMTPAVNIQTLGSVLVNAGQRFSKRWAVFFRLFACPR